MIMTDWRNRIIRYGEQAADQFTAHPENPRRHPQAQREAVKGSLDTLGWIAPVIVSRASGFMIDGHERIFQALAQGDDTPVPFIEVDLSEDEERLALASFDFITQMAVYDRDTLDTLLQQVNTDDAALQSLLSELAAENGVIPQLDYGNSNSGNGGDSDTDGDYTPLDSNIRMAQLFLTDANFDEFYALVKQLKEKFQRDNLTDSVLEAMRYAVHHR